MNCVRCNGELPPAKPTGRKPTVCFACKKVRKALRERTRKGVRDRSCLECGIVIAPQAGFPSNYCVGHRWNHSCIIDQCERPAGVARGYCTIHYQRWHRLGDPLAPLTLVPRGGITPSGYRMIRTNGRNLLEHRAVMADMIGRELWSDENVHHINGVRHDNRPENLELWSSSQPPGQRVADKVQWAVEILKRYAPERLSDGAS